jgi:hypothetical protein
MFQVASPAKIVAISVCFLACCLPLAAGQQTLSGSEWYRAEKCAGDYVCDEDDAGVAVAWLQVCVDAAQTRFETLPRKTAEVNKPDPRPAIPSQKPRRC